MKDWVTLARLVRPRGNRGELLAEPLSENRNRFSGLGEVTLFLPGRPEDEGRTMRIESVWWHQGRLVLKFEGIDSIGQAEGLRGAAVSIPACERAPLAAGEYYRDDLIGCEWPCRFGQG